MTRFRSLVLGALAAVGARPASAQQNFLVGFAGLKAGSQAPAGLYASVNYWNFNASTLITNGGRSLGLHPGVTQQFAGVGLSWVTKHELFGATYGAIAVLPFATSRVELDSLGVSAKSHWGYTSTYLQPMNLGWHLNRADVLVGYAVYLPTGRYTFGANDNNGLGMWTQELSAGTTLYFNAKKSPHLALALYYDINSEKRDTTFKQSNPLTLEGGLGANYGAKTFAGWAGLVGFAQWDVTHTRYRVTRPAPLSLNLPLGRSFGLGPEVTTLQGGLTLRYLWEFGARSSLQGRVAFVQFAYPIGK